MIAAAAALLATATTPAQRPPVPPRSAPASFSTSRYGLTFRMPHGLSYCPLPADWVGSDHGTMLFLAAPRRCAGGAGFPSSGRGYDPADTPRIEVFYAYDPDDPDARSPRCRQRTATRVLGHRASLCRGHEGARVTWSTTVAYPVAGGQRADLSVTLVTPPARERRDLAVLRALLASVATCSDTWHEEDRAGHPTGRPFTTGVGAPCPADARFF